MDPDARRHIVPGHGRLQPCPEHDKRARRQGRRRRRHRRRDADRHEREPRRARSARRHRRADARHPRTHLARDAGPGERGDKL